LSLFSGDNSATTPSGCYLSTVHFPVDHIAQMPGETCQEDLNIFPLGELEEDTIVLLDEDFPAGPEIQ